MIVGIDATPAVRQFAGVGRYTRELLRELVLLDASDDFRLLCAAPALECNALLSLLPPGARREVRQLPLSDRFATIAWQRLRVPVHVERFTGLVNVFHGPDFVAPPARCPVVVTIHDMSFLRAPQFHEASLVEYLRRAVERSVRAADRVITVSAAVAVDVCEAYPWAQHKLVAIPNGVRAPEAPVPRRESAQPTVLIVGTVEPRKNHQLLLDATRIARATYPDVRLVIAGRVGWQANDIIQDIRRAEADGIATFVESPSDAELERIYAEATIAVFPSHFEGFGLPVLEAMIRGVPTIVSDIAAHREVAGTAARYVNPNDAEDLAHAIVEMLDSSDTLRECARQGIARASAFSWAETARRTRHVYQSALGGRSRCD